MNRAHWTPLFLSILLLSACGEAGSRAADVVQAATKGAAEVGQQLAEKAAELAGMTPEEAKGKLQELLDVAAKELKTVKDSETAKTIATEIQRILEQLGVFAMKLGQKLNVSGLQKSAQDLLEKFKNDPDVARALKGLQEKLNSLAR